MKEINAEEKFTEEVFTYKTSKDNKIFIFWFGKQVMILKGNK